MVNNQGWLKKGNQILWKDNLECDKWKQEDTNSYRDLLLIKNKKPGKKNYRVIFSHVYSDEP